MTDLLGRFFSSLSTIPKPIREFLSRGLILLIIWKILYLGFLAFPRTLDQPLTSLVGSQSASLLNRLTHSEDYSAKDTIDRTDFEGQIQLASVSRIEKNGKKIMHIADGCNGLELFVLYIGFILAMPASARRKIVFIAIGVFIIHVVNVFRCVGLTVMVVSWREHFDIAHHYIFKMMIYSVIFGLWVKFSENITFKKDLDHAL